MQFVNIADKATHKLKVGAGYVQGITVVSAGSGSWALQVYDSTNYSSPDNVILGATAMVLPAAGTFIKLDCHFSNGLIVKTSTGTAGEIVVTYQ